MDSRGKVPAPVYNVHYAQRGHFTVRPIPQSRRTNQQGTRQSSQNVRTTTSQAQHMQLPVQQPLLQPQAGRLRTGQQRAGLQRVGQQREVQPIEIVPIPQSTMQQQRTTHQRTRSGPQQRTVSQQCSIAQQHVVQPPRVMQHQQRGMPQHVISQQRAMHHQRTVSQPQQRTVQQQRNIQQQQRMAPQLRSMQQRPLQQQQMSHVVQPSHQQRPQHMTPNQIPVSTHGYTYHGTATNNSAGPPNKRSRISTLQTESDSLPLDLSKSSPLPIRSPMNTNLPVSKSSPITVPKNTQMPLDLSSKSSTPAVKEKETTAPTTVYTLLQCPFCNMTCTNSNQMRNHLEHCPKLSASPLVLNRERWVENNVPPPMPSTSSSQMRVDDIASVRDNLPRINGANVIGEFIIQDDPFYIKQEIDSEDDTEIVETILSVKSIDKSCYKSSAKKSSPLTNLPEKRMTTEKNQPVVTTFDISVSSQKEVSIEPVTVPKASRPVLSCRSILKDRQKSPDETRLTVKTAALSRIQGVSESSKEVSLKKIPEGQAVDSHQSSTSIKSSEKRPAKRQPELSIHNIADNLLRRMAQKTQKTSIPESASSSEVENVTIKDKMQEEEPKVDEVQQESSEDEVSFKDLQPEKEIVELPSLPIEENLMAEPESTVDESPVEDQLLVYEPKKSASPVKTSKQNPAKELEGEVEKRQVDEEEEEDEVENQQEEEVENQEEEVENQEEQEKQEEEEEKQKEEEEEIQDEEQEQEENQDEEQEQEENQEEVQVEEEEKQNEEEMQKAKQVEEEQQTKMEDEEEEEKQKAKQEETQEQEEEEQVPMRTTRSRKDTKKLAPTVMSEILDKVPEIVSRPVTPTKLEEKPTGESNTPLNDNRLEITKSTRESRKRGGTSPIKGTPAKKQALEEMVKEPEMVTPSKGGKPIKSPPKKSPKGERLSKDEVAEISKLAHDLGCLRRSSRTKVTLEEATAAQTPSQILAKPTGPDSEDLMKTSKAKAQAQEISEVKEPTLKKAGKTAKGDGENSESQNIVAKENSTSQESIIARETSKVNTLVQESCEVIELALKQASKAAKADAQMSETRTMTTKSISEESVISKEISKANIQVQESIEVEEPTLSKAAKGNVPKSGSPNKVAKEKTISQDSLLSRETPKTKPQVAESIEDAEPTSNKACKAVKADAQKSVIPTRMVKEKSQSEESIISRETPKVTAQIEETSEVTKTPPKKASKAAKSDTQKGETPTRTVKEKSTSQESIITRGTPIFTAQAEETSEVTKTTPKKAGKAAKADIQKTETPTEAVKEKSTSEGSVISEETPKITAQVQEISKVIETTLKKAGKVAKGDAQKFETLTRAAKEKSTPQVPVVSRDAPKTRAQVHESSEIKEPTSKKSSKAAKADEQKSEAPSRAVKDKSVSQESSKVKRPTSTRAGRVIKAIVQISESPTRAAKDKSTSLLPRETSKAKVQVQENSQAKEPTSKKTSKTAKPNAYTSETLTRAAKEKYAFQESGTSGEMVDYKVQVKEGSEVKEPTSKKVSKAAKVNAHTSETLTRAAKEKYAFEESFASEEMPNPIAQGKANSQVKEPTSKKVSKAAKPNAHTGETLTRAAKEKYAFQESVASEETPNTKAQVKEGSEVNEPTSKKASKVAKADAQYSEMLTKAAKEKSKPQETAVAKETLNAKAQAQESSQGKELASKKHSSVTKADTQKREISTRAAKEKSTLQGAVVTREIPNAKAQIQESTEFNEPKSKQVSKTSKADVQKSEPPITRTAKENSTPQVSTLSKEKPETKVPKEKMTKAKSQTILKESFSKQATKKKSEETSEAKVGSSKKNKLVTVSSIVKRSAKQKGKDKKINIKPETTIFDEHVAAIKTKRVRLKRGESSIPETKAVENKTKKDKKDKKDNVVGDKVEENKVENNNVRGNEDVNKAVKDTDLRQDEMDAVEELVKLSLGEPAKSPPKKKKVKKGKSTSLSKVDDIYNRHVAVLRGKINKRGKLKKMAKRVKQGNVDEEVEEKKMTRIVGRKVYKQWLETQANVTDKSSEIAQRKMPRQAFEATRTKTEQWAANDKMASEKVASDKAVSDIVISDIVISDSVVSDIVETQNDNHPVVDSLSAQGLSEKKASGKLRKKPDMRDEDNVMFLCDLECAKCKLPIKSRKDFNAHMQCHSSDPKMKGCPVCGQLFRNQNRCYGHLLREHAGWKSFHECPYCLRKYSRKDAVQVHIGSVHPKEHRKELAKKYGYGLKDDEEEEFKDEDIVLNLMCKRCNRPIRSKGDCYTHVLLHSQPGSRENRSRVCPLCDKMARDTLEIWEHLVIEHADIKPFTCDQCDTSFTSKATLKKHQQTLHKKFVEPIARVRSGFDSENWDIGMNQHMAEEPQGPLPLSSGRVLSLLELSLNTLVISQRNKIQKLNQLLTGHDTTFGSIMGSMYSNENDNDKLNMEEQKKEEDAEEDGNASMKTEDEQEEESQSPYVTAMIASKKMIPVECETMELPCVLCPTGILGSDEFKLHVLKHICDSTRVCPVCRRTFSRKSSCRRHLIEHTYNWKHKCDLCSGAFPKGEYLGKHYHKHLEQGYQCLNCLLKFESGRELWQHLNPGKDSVAEGKKPDAHQLVKFPCRRVHVCTKCHQEFRSAWGLQYHLENAHTENLDPVKGFRCLICSKCFKSHITLKNHQEIHEENASHVCRHCNLVCRTKRQLTKHMEYKHMEKIYKCAYCTKMFATRSRLKEHAIMHQNKTFFCDMCGKVYRHQRVFETHCRQHFNPPVKKHRLYPCAECNHVSKSKEQLNLHVRRHTGERPFKCKQCPKAFSSQTGVWRHQMSHAGKKPHSCHLCGKSFVQKCSLDRHLLSHAGIKPYRCEYCSAEYSQSYPLTKHMERKHPDMPFILVKKEDMLPSSSAAAVAAAAAAATTSTATATTTHAPISKVPSTVTENKTKGIAVLEDKGAPTYSGKCDVDIFYMTDRENGAMNSQDLQPLTEIQPLNGIQDPPIVCTENNMLLAQL